MGNARNVASRAAWLGSAGISSAVDELNFLVGGHDGDERVGVLVGSTGERRRLHRLRNRSRRGRRGTPSTTGCKNDGEYKNGKRRTANVNPAHMVSLGRGCALAAQLCLKLILAS